MMRKLSLYVLISVFLLLLSMAVYAATTSLTLSEVTNLDITIKGTVDKPNVSIVIFDPKTNKQVGKGTAQADAQGVFWTQIVYNSALQGENDLVMNIIDTDNNNYGVTTSINLWVECALQQSTNLQRLNCDWRVSGPMLGGETMGFGH